MGLGRKLSVWRVKVFFVEKTGGFGEKTGSFGEKNDICRGKHLICRENALFCRDNQHVRRESQPSSDSNPKRTYFTGKKAQHHTIMLGFKFALFCENRIG